MKKENKYLIYIGLIFLGVAIGVIFTSKFELTPTGQASSKTTFVDENFSFQTNNNNYPSTSANSPFANSFIEINKRVTPAVVSIETERVVSKVDVKKYHEDENKLWDLFQDKLNPFRSPQRFPMRGSGSGIIVHEKGYILTNTHVVDDASRLEVTLTDNRKFRGRIVGIDPLTEVAVIKIKGDNLPVAQLGNSDNLQVGEWVMAIGNPLELRFTVTAGIISAIGRNMNIIQDSWGIENFIQTDAVINPGNSGGAMVNLQGEVIGVNTAIATRTGFYEGYGFAIPINLAKTIMEDLITKGRVARAYLGILMQPMDQKKAKAYGLERPVGIFIDAVLKDSPADDAGVKSEDILVDVDGVEIVRTNQVQSIIAQKKPGTQVDIIVIRDGQRRNISVLLEERQNSEKQVSYYVPDESEEEPKLLGLRVQTLKRKQARELGLSNVKGVLVVNVSRFSNASQAGLFVNDVILKINNDEITDEENFWNSLERLESGDVAKIYIYNRSNQTKATVSHRFLEIP